MHPNVKILTKSLKTDFFFTLCLTENEHYIVEDMIREKCLELGYEVSYYRKFNEPMYRECKIKCSPAEGDKLLFTATEFVLVHPLLSVTVTVYDAAGNPVAVAAVPPAGVHA